MTIAANLEAVQARMAEACAQAGRNPSDVTLVAVSKTHPPADVLEAAAAGLQHFGENRVEESESKIPAVMAAFGSPVTWHMIGHIQSRKAKDVVALFDVVHSVDTLKLAQRLSRFAQEQGRVLDALLEVNISGETSKSGLVAAGWETDPALRDRLWADVGAMLALPGLQVRGLMTMAPIVEDMEHTRPIFAGLRGLRDALARSFGVALPDLSMGMTDDYPVAIEEGATLVRIGRAIFGERIR